MPDHKTIIAGTVAVIVLYLFARSQATEIAEDIGKAINPIDRNNIFNRGFNATLESIGAVDQGGSLGTKFADHCIRKAKENGGRIPEDFPWYCPEP